MSTKQPLIAFGKFMTFALALIVMGCETSDATLRDAGRNEAYIIGFHDGRHSGMKEAGNYLEHMVKDTKRFEEDADYREGWLAGEQEGMGHPFQADGILQGVGDVVLADKLVKVTRAILAGKNEIGHHTSFRFGRVVGNGNRTARAFLGYWAIARALRT